MAYTVCKNADAPTRGALHAKFVASTAIGCNGHLPRTGFYPNSTEIPIPPIQVPGLPRKMEAETGLAQSKRLIRVRVVHSLLSPRGNRRVPYLPEGKVDSLWVNKKMAVCKRCGVAVHWSLGTPYDGKGTDHRENCAGLTVDTKLKIRDQNHEARVNDFFAGVINKRKGGRRGT